MKYFLIILLFSLMAIPSCYYDSEENLYPTVDCKTSDVSYANEVKPIIDISCNSCHSASENQGFVILEAHSDILKYANNGSLVGSIEHKSGWSAMPKSASKLDACKIDKITSWVNAGAPNN